MPSSAKTTGAMSSDVLSTVVKKKLNHNASERDRRKKLNCLYSSLRYLLPGTNDHSKKSSIPVTISRVVKYIPELQKQVEKLIRRKEELLTTVLTHQYYDDINSNYVSSSKKNKEATDVMNLTHSNLPSVSANQVDDKEVVIQICTTLKLKKILLSEVLLNLEADEDLQIINATTFASTDDRIFYNLHVKVKETQRIECEVLREKLISLCGKENYFA